MKKIFLHLFPVLFLLINSCNAPRNNPLDPENPDNKIIAIDGIVRTDTRDPQPITGVNVYWMNEKISGFTNGNGYFKLKCSGQKDGWLYFEKEGFNKDSVFVTWNNKTKISLEVNLNSLPVLNSINLYSLIRNKYSNVDYQIVVDCEITDIDDDIDSVYLVNQGYKISKMLNKLNAKDFGGKFYDYDLGLSSIENLVGKNFDIVIKSSTGKEIVVGKSSIKRIIKDVIEFISPANQDIVTNTPSLRWKKFTQGFNFTFTVEVYTDETEPQLMWSKDSIASGETSIDVDVPLTVTPNNNKFFWVIWCVDEYKNMARSRTAGFVVQ